MITALKIRLYKLIFPEPEPLESLLAAEKCVAFREMQRLDSDYLHILNAIEDYQFKKAKLEVRLARLESGTLPEVEIKRPPSWAGKLYGAAS